ncbi:glycosyltransferase [Methylorubrum extorquens]
MIFVTVGVQLPFDRLVGAVDTWAGTRRRSDVVAQIGSSKLVPKHIRYQATMTPTEFRRCVTDATAVVAHAGMGSIITALELGKPILIMPRRAAFGEHRNDHQLSTSRLMAEQNIVTVAEDEGELIKLLDRIESLGRSAEISSHAGAQLIGRISAFIAEIDRGR